MTDLNNMSVAELCALLDTIEQLRQATVRAIREKQNER